MAEVTIHRCDRCGQEMKPQAPGWLRVTILHAHHVREIELCAAKCAREFREWMDPTGRTRA